MDEKRSNFTPITDKIVEKARKILEMNPRLSSSQKQGIMGAVKSSQIRQQIFTKGKNLDVRG